MKSSNTPNEKVAELQPDERKALEEMNAIRRSQHQPSHNRLAAFNEQYHMPDSISYHNTVVKIGIVDEHGMHTLQVHSDEEFIETITAANGWTAKDPQVAITGEITTTGGAPENDLSDKVRYIKEVGEWAGIEFNSYEEAYAWQANEYKANYFPDSDLLEIDSSDDRDR